MPSIRDPSFGTFIRSHKRTILEAWKRKARATVGQARRVGDSALVDHVPYLLDHLAELSEAFERGEERARVAREPLEHARQRVIEGYELAEVIAEYSVLRECILELWERENAPSASASSTRPLHRALDHAVSESVDHYARLRDRVLKAIDSVSAAAFTSSGLDELLERLLHVFMESMPAVQTSAILLREGERLRVRAAVGLEEELAGEGFSLAIGEGFAGTVAQTRRPLMLRSAATDSLVKSPVIHQRRVKALYGVPICHDSRGVMGVAHMGSLSAEDFSEDDKHMFSTMVARAALAIEYQMAKKAAQDAVHTRDEILAVVSHDLRNPLGAVLTAAELLRRVMPEDHRMRKAVGTIQRAGSQMTRLVEDLLDFGAIESGQLRVQLRPEPAEALVAEAIAGHGALAAEHGLHLRASEGDALPPVMCDRERIFQVFTNLISNAIRFSPPGSTITLRARREGATVCFSVVDEGSGIDEADVPRVFDRYWRGHRGSGRGRGLGLAIVKGIVDAHRGVVAVESTRGKGTTFSFRLPIAA